MAGYNGFSMSNNAVSAYENGEKPLSKWTKKDILSGIKAIDVELKCDFSKLQKAPVKVLKDLCLYCSSWHHTSSHYNKTDFYSIDEDKVENLTDEQIEDAILSSKHIEEKPAEEKWKCAFLEWSGSRKHPKATEVIEIGVVKGDWFYREDGSKKKTTANGFRFIEKIQ